MRILHLADVHLDRPFVGLSLTAARRRRQELRRTFEGCLNLAATHEADLVTIGGDLWEEEHVTVDTRAWVAAKLEELGLPVAIIGGNHDQLIPGGNHLRAAWPTNVHHFRSPEPTELQLDDVSIWGASWIGGGFSTAFLERFTVPEDGRTHLLLLHGTSGAGYLDEEGRYGPFDVQSISRAGFAKCLAGHIHAAHDVDRVIYPGSPEPLRWSETGRHCVAIVEVTEGQVQVELIDVNMREYAHLTVNVDGASSSADLERALDAALDLPSPDRIYARITLTGEIDDTCSIHPAELAERHDGYAAVVILDETRRRFDFAELAERPTALGRFVKELSDQIDSAEGVDQETLELALLAGVRAMHGEAEVLHVD